MNCIQTGFWWFQNIIVCGAMLFCMCTQVKAETYTITDFGALPDGKTDNTAAIQKAIDACALTGGTVLFPSGTFLSGTLLLKSNVTLLLSKNCRLLGSTDLHAYPYLESGINFYGHDWAKQSLIFSQHAENVSIEGEGTIDGQGSSFTITTNKKPDRYRNRPYLLWFVSCKNVTVKGISLRNSAFWMQHYLGCESVLIDHINIWNHSNKNNDMLDIDGCKNVVITNIQGDSDDDGLTLKSTSPLISENIAISGCLFSSHCNALKLGTESTGGFRNVTITNCVIRPSKQLTTIYGTARGNNGISLEMVDGGIMENINISNIVIDGPQVPLFIRLGNRARKYADSAATPAVGRIRNISISNIIATGADTTGCSFTGLPGHPVENISLSNISVETGGGGTAKDMFKIIDEQETAYPEATMFGKLPAYGLYFSHATGVKLHNITFRYALHEERPAIAFADVKNFSLSGTDLQSEDGTNAVLFIKHGSYGLISNCNHAYPAKYFVWEDGSSQYVSLFNNACPAIKTIGKKEQLKAHQ